VADTVQVGVSAGEAFTWTNATFDWSSGTAAKLWSASTRTQHDVGVAVSCSFSEARRIALSKKLVDAFQAQDALRRASQIKRAEGVSLADSHAGTVTFVRHLAEGFNTADSRMVQATKHLACALSATDRVSDSVQKHLNDSLSLQAALQRHATKRHSESIAIAQTYADLISYWLRFVESVALADQRTVGVNKACSEDVTLDDALRRSAQKSLLETLAMGGALSRQSHLYQPESLALDSGSDNLVEFERRFDESVTVQESRRFHADKFILRDLVFAELLVSEFAKALHGEFALGESHLTDFQRRVIEAFVVGAVFGRGISLPLSDHFALASFKSQEMTSQQGETLAVAGLAFRELAQAFAELMTLVSFANRKTDKSLSEDLALVDGVGQDLIKLFLDAIGFAQTYTDLIAFVVSVSEHMALQDWSANDVAKQAAEQFGLDDKVASDVAKQITDLLAMSDLLAADVGKVLIEALVVRDDYTDVIEFVRTFLEGLGFESALIRSGTKAFSESIDVQRTLALQSFKVIVEELGWATAPILETFKRAYESWATADAIKRDVLVRVAESVALLETYTDLIAFVVSVSEALRVQEQHANETVKPVDEAFVATEAGNREFIKDVRVGLDFVEGLAKDLHQVLREMLELDGASSKSATKAFEDALCAIDDLKRQATVAPNESVALAEMLSRDLSRPIVEAIALASASHRSPTKAVGDAFSAKDALRRSGIARWTTLIGVDGRLGQQAVKPMQEAVVLGASLGRHTSKVTAEDLRAVGTLTRQTVKPLSEALALIGQHADLVDWILQLTEGVALADAFKRSVAKGIQEPLGISSILGKSTLRPLTEAFALAELTGRATAYRRTLNEGFSTNEAIKRASTLSIAQALDIAEQYRRHANGVISDMIVSSGELNEQDFMDIVDAGHAPGYTDFRDFIAGDYTYAKAMFRAVLSARNADRGYIKGLRLSVDVPDVLDRGTATITDATNGVSVSFVRSFRAPPEVTLTHKGGSVIAIARLSGNATTTGFTAVLEDSTGQRVPGMFSWIAQGY
jgi:sulfur relay (sulfurtransferase) DsrC/TusE family protein